MTMDSEVGLRTCPITVYLDKDTREKLDKARGKITRSTFAAILIDEMLAIV